MVFFIYYLMMIKLPLWSHERIRQVFLHTWLLNVTHSFCWNLLLECRLLIESNLQLSSIPTCWQLITTVIYFLYPKRLCRLPKIILICTIYYKKKKIRVRDISFYLFYKILYDFRSVKHSSAMKWRHFLYITRTQALCLFVRL